MFSKKDSEVTQQENGRQTFAHDKRDRAINYVFRRDLHLTLMFSGLLQKDSF